MIEVRMYRSIKIFNYLEKNEEDISFKTNLAYCILPSVCAVSLTWLDQ